jgi:hypothetical protein
MTQPMAFLTLANISFEYTLTILNACVHARNACVKIKSNPQMRSSTSHGVAGGVWPADLAQIMKDLATLREQVKNSPYSARAVASSA